MLIRAFQNLANPAISAVQDAVAVLARSGISDLLAGRQLHEKPQQLGNEGAQFAELLPTLLLQPERLDCELLDLLRKFFPRNDWRS